MVTTLGVFCVQIGTAGDALCDNEANKPCGKLQVVSCYMCLKLCLVKDVCSSNSFDKSQFVRHCAYHAYLKCSL